MNIMETVAQIKSQLEQIELKEKANQQEQVKVNQHIVELETKLQQKQQLRNQLDGEALRLHTQAEELRPKLNKLERIASLSQEFLELHAECQGNQDLLNTLYSSVSNISVEDNHKKALNQALINLDEYAIVSEIPDNPNSYADYSISIDQIRQALPNAEKMYQQLVARNLEEYKTYQNYIVDGLDLIWYAVAFSLFGRSSYLKMSFKYHPDLDGSEKAMQLINTAWAISQNFEDSTSNETVKNL